MKACSALFPLMVLLLMLGAAAGNFPLPAPGNVWLLPGLSLLALAGGFLPSRLSGFGRTDPSDEPPPVANPGKLPARIWIAGGLLLGLVALYAWNPSHDWTAGRGPVPIEHVRGLAASSFPEGTWSAFRLALAMFAVFVLGFRLSLRQIRGLQGIAAAAALAMALTVLVQRLEPNAHRIREVTGIFVNENHFAVFSNLLLPTVLALASRARFRAVRDGRPSSPAGLFLLAAALMAAAVVLCRSRAGVAVMALLIAAHVWTCRRTVRQYPFVSIPFSFWAKGFGWAAIAAAGGFAVRALWLEWRHVEAIGREWAFRSGILKDALVAWREQPVWGIGPGTFPVVFPFYQSAMFDGKTILHAHCEPIQFLVEFGAAGALVVLAALVLSLSARRRTSVSAAADIPPFADVERRAFGFGLSACALHCLIDFPLRSPLIALLAAVWAGVWAGTRPAKAGGDRRA